MRSIPLLFALVALGLFAGGCDGRSPEDPFAECGNGVVDAGEECDDGRHCFGGANDGAPCASDDDCSGEACQVRDADACLGTCKRNRCGDGLIDPAAEECDLNRLAGKSCGSFGLSGGPLSCSGGCTFDTSKCGPANTPSPVLSTPTPSATLTPTATPTVTATPPPLCGNGSVDPGETCDDGNASDDDACPDTCVIRACTPGTQQVSVTGTVNSAFPIGTLELLVKYPDGDVGIPGSGTQPSVGQRVTNTPPGAFVVRNDLDHALRMIISRAQPLPLGELFTVAFDACAGGAPVAQESFECKIVAAVDPFSTAVAATCTLHIN
jgi:cysteine-rich repeat protein